MLRLAIICWSLAILGSGIIVRSNGANILMVHPVVSRSHELVFITVGEELASRGHNVTLVRFKGRSRMPTKLIRVVNVEMNSNGRHVPYMNADGEVEPPHDLLWKLSRNFLAIPLDIIVPVSVACDSLLSNNVTSHTVFDRKYDIAIVDLLFNECGLAFVHQKRLPVVAYWASIQHAGELFFTSSTMSPAIVPSLMTDYTDRMNFVQRLINTGFYIGGRLFATFFMVNPMHSVIARHLPESPHPSELINNISMLFINSDFALDFARPITPNTIYIGCIQCRLAKPLSKDLEEFMQSSGDNGVIVFSLGATFSEGGLRKVDVETLYEAFGSLKQKVILKMSKTWQHQVEIPNNVMAVDWLPQQDILGHPKTKLMITHCGMHGVMEGIYHGIPMIGIPIFGDQGDVFVRMEKAGIAVGVQKSNLTSDNLLKAIHTALDDKRFLLNVQRLSRIIRDQPQSALERAIFWIEYVARHDGANHLKTADRHLNLIQYLLVDVLLVALTTVLAVGFLLKRSFGYVRRCRQTKINNNVREDKKRS